MAYLQFNIGDYEYESEFEPTSSYTKLVVNVSNPPTNGLLKLIWSDDGINTSVIEILSVKSSRKYIFARKIRKDYLSIEFILDD